MAYPSVRLHGKGERALTQMNHEMPNDRHWRRSSYPVFALSLIGLLGLALSAASSVGRAQGRQERAETGSLRGRIREQRGRSLAGVKVEAARQSGTDSAAETASPTGTYATESNSQGEFLLGSLPPGDYVLSFSLSGYRTFTTRRLTVTAGESVRLSRVIELAREEAPYAVIRGAVLQGVGFTMPNALVTLERIDGGRKLRQRTISHEGGEFAFRLRAEKATYRVTASSPGWKAATLEIEIENDEVRNVALVLEPLP